MGYLWAQVRDPVSVNKVESDGGWRLTSIAGPHTHLYLHICIDIQAKRKVKQNKNRKKERKRINKQR